MDKLLKDFIVAPEHTAAVIGSGGLPVLSTPSLIAYIENVCYEWLETQLDESFTSVGTQMEIRHLKPTKVSEKVTIEVEIIEKNHRNTTFNCLATHQGVTIATAFHKRSVVEIQSFLEQI